MLNAAVTLAVAFAALPLMLDLCVASCDAAESMPACHHQSPATSQIGQLPVPCGHDHSGIVVTVETHGVVSVHTFDSTVAVLVLPVLVPRAASEQPVFTHAPPGSSVTLDSHSLPLRI